MPSDLCRYLISWLRSHCCCCCRLSYHISHLGLMLFFALFRFISSLHLFAFFSSSGTWFRCAILKTNNDYSLIACIEQPFFHLWVWYQATPLISSIFNSLIMIYCAAIFFSFCGFRYQSAPLIIPSLSQKSGKQGSSWLPVEYIYHRFQIYTTEMLNIYITDFKYV